VVDREEDKMIWVYLEERFGSETAINVGNFCFVCFFGILVFVAAFLRARAVFVFVQNSSQLSPLL